MAQSDSVGDRLRLRAAFRTSVTEIPGIRRQLR
jgi:hypothetical protein